MPAIPKPTARQPRWNWAAPIRRIPASRVSDPPLKQVVSRTMETGLRGSKDLNIGTLGWKLGVFRADNTDDILAIPSPVLQGFGYFQNVGSTRRQGLEAEVTLRSSA